MSEQYVNGVPVDIKLLEELNQAIRINSDITAKQNNLMLKYTKWLCWLTIAIGIIAILQLITMFIK